MLPRVFSFGDYQAFFLSYNFNSILLNGSLISVFVTILLTSRMSLHKHQLKLDYSRLVRSAGRLLLLLISTFLFCFQQTAGLVYRAELSKEVQFRSEVQTKSRVPQIGILLSVQLPELPAVEQLEPSEDDDQQHVQPSFSNESTRPLLLLEWAYAQVIKTRFRQQTFAVKQTNRLPLFLLHHQWRTIPS